MYSIALTQAGAAEAAWARMHAAQELRHATESLDIAAASLVGIASVASWESDGVRALQGVIEALRHQTAPVRVDLQAREREIERTPES